MGHLTDLQLEQHFLLHESVALKGIALSPLRRGGISTETSNSFIEHMESIALR